MIPLLKDIKTDQSKEGNKAKSPLFLVVSIFSAVVILITLADLYFMYKYFYTF